jgi:hypothetical protein
VSYKVLFFFVSVKPPPRSAQVILLFAISSSVFHLVSVISSAPSYFRIFLPRVASLGSSAGHESSSCLCCLRVLGRAPALQQGCIDSLICLAACSSPCDCYRDSCVRSVFSSQGSTGRSVLHWFSPPEQEQWVVEILVFFSFDFFGLLCVNGYREMSV